MKNATALIRDKKGHGGVKKFIENDLGMKYRTFVHQCETGTVQYKVIKKLMELLDIKFEDFNDYEYIDNHEAKSKEQKKEEKKERTIQSAIEELEKTKPKKLSQIFGN